MTVTTYAKFDGIQEEIKKLLYQAGDSVRICVAWLSFQIYGPILSELVRSGVDVSLIVNNDEKNEIEQLNSIEGLSFKPLMMREYGKLMHNKFCIIDDRVVITGSYNWSSNAEGHFENIIVIRDDFALVKQFLHEFEDLSQYHVDKVNFDKCHCKSNLFTLAIFGYEQGKYNDSTVGLWSVCVKNNHVEFLGSRDEQYLHTHLGMTSEDDEFKIDLSAYGTTVWDMRSAFNEERKYRRRVQSYFDREHGIKAHGVGWVICTNTNEYYKGYADPEFEVLITFRSAYFRKIVPAMLENYSGDIESIIEMHKPVV